MQAIKSVLNIEGEMVVPIRIIPYSTGGDVTPLGIAQVLSDANQRVSAFVYVQGPAGSDIRMLPKEWNQIVQRLHQMQSDTPVGTTRESLLCLPPATYVKLTDLQRIYAENYLPPREDWETYSDVERENFVLKEQALVPDDLVECALEGFEPSTQPANIPVSQQPVARAQAQETAILRAIADAGHDPLSLPKQVKGRAGIKSATRKTLGNSGMWAGTTVFDKAWDRLRSKGAIANEI